MAWPVLIHVRLLAVEKCVIRIPIQSWIARCIGPTLAQKLVVSF
jgi:hypothetical protein